MTPDMRLVYHDNVPVKIGFSRQWMFGRAMLLASTLCGGTARARQYALVMVDRVCNLRQTDPCGIGLLVRIMQPRRYDLYETPSLSQGLTRIAQL